MEQTLSTDPAVEAHVVVRYEPGCPGECFLSYRSALMQARATVAPYYRGDTTVVSS